MSVDDVRDVINVSAADVPDGKVLKMIKRAEVTLELGREQPFLADYLFALRSTSLNEGSLGCCKLKCNERARYEIGAAVEPVGVKLTVYTS